MSTVRPALIRLSILISLLFGIALVSGLPAQAQAGCEPAWNVFASPNGSGDDNALGDVTVIGANDIWAVGNTGAGANPLNTLTEHWNGNSWNVVPSPNGVFPVNYLVSVSAVSGSDVWAVGYSYNGSVSDSQSKTLIVHWNGSNWSVVPSPNTNNPENRLLGVAAVSANDVWAVGHWYDFTDFRTLIMHWNGVSWSIVPSPNPPGAFANFLYGIEAVSANNIWAVGSTQESIEQTLALHWNGSAWSVVPTPNIGFFHNNMLEVEAVSASDIWAVGFHQTVIGVDQPYQTSAFHYNGTSWSIVPTPNVNTLNNYLFDVVGLSAGDAWAVGFWDTGDALNTMIQHWDGQSWTIQSSPSPGQFINELTGIDVVSASELWTVGTTVGSFVGSDTLIERYSPACVTATPTKTPRGTPGAATATPTGQTPTPTKTPRGTVVPTNTPTSPGPTPTQTKTPRGGP
jgi:hypothetical protein